MTRVMGLVCGAAAALSVVAVQGGPARAVPAGLAAGIRAAADDMSAVEPAQFIFGGRNYCFYLDGWHGPGWYWCGYAFRHGLGWGGPEGWHGWHHGGGGHVGRPGGRRHVNQHGGGHGGHPHR